MLVYLDCSEPVVAGYRRKYTNMYETRRLPVTCGEG